jgi:hypothetical protein
MAERKTAAKAKKAEPKRKPPPGTRSVLIYLPDELVAGLDAWVSALNEGKRGPQWARSDVIKAALQRSVDERGSKGEEP